MNEINKSFIHEAGHVCMGVLEKVPVLRIMYDRPNGMWTTTYGQTTIRGDVDYTLIRLFLAGPAVETLMFGGYDTETCWMDEEKAYGILVKRHWETPSRKISTKQIMKEILNECYKRLEPFYSDFLKLEAIYRHYLIIEGINIQEICGTFQRSANGIPPEHGSECTGNSDSIITTLR